MSSGTPQNHATPPSFHLALRGLWLIALALLVGRAPAADLKVQGLRSIKEKEALDLLGDRLEYVRSRPPTPSRASDAAFLLENLMRRQGFQQPSVTWAISGNTIRLIVNEGQRLAIGAVEIPGYDEEQQKRLGRLFILPGQERVLSPGQDPPFRESDVDEGLQLLVADFNSRGYWKATATVENRSVDPRTGKIFFRVRIVSGAEFHLRAPRFEGAPADSMAELQAKSAPYVGKVANTDHLTRLRGEIEGIFRATGYPLETFEMDRVLENDQLTPHFLIKFGVRQRLKEVYVKGLVKTNPKRVLARFKDLKGEWFDAGKFDARIRKLLGTGAFSSVRTENSTSPDGFLDATLQITEGRARGTTTYAGVGSYEGVLFGLKYHDRNLMGNLWNFSAGVEISSRGMLGEVRVSDPWLFDSDTYLGLRLFSVTRAFQGYDKFETGLSAEFSRDLIPHLDASLTFGTSVVDISSISIPADVLGETSYTHNFIRADLAYDRRDDPVSPTRGYHLRGLAEYGFVVGDESSTYTKFEAASAGYIPLGRKDQINLGLRAGLLFPSTDASAFPIDLRYFLGGADSVRSFPYRELGPKAPNGDPSGGESYWVANAEYVRSLFGPVKGVTFIDAGFISPLSGDIETASPDVAVGLGLRLDLPIGPVRLEYGHNLTQDPGEPAGAFHFAIGIAF